MIDFNALDVVVLAGGISHERDVSLRSGRRVADALTTAGHRATLLDPNADLLPNLSAHRPDVIFPALHGSSGEDGSLLSLLAALALPTVGSTAEAARRTWSKPNASSVVANAGVRVPRSVSLSQESFRELGANGVLRVVKDYLVGDVVVKPSSGGSAQGVSIVEDPTHLARAVVEAFNYNDHALIEERITGTELALTILDIPGNTSVFPAVEIEPTDGTYGYAARYNAGLTTFYTPARLDGTAAAAVAHAALTAHQALGLRDISRIDFVVDASGTPWFLEANVLPGFTETSLVPLAIEASGCSVSDVYGSLVTAAWQRSRQNT